MALPARWYRRRPPRFLIGTVCALVLLAGCRGKAYRQVYTEKLTSEIRVLEDQLYACGYENKVLSEKLERLQAELDARQGRNRAAPLREDEEGASEPQRRAAPPAAEPESDVIPGAPAPPDIDLGIPDDPSALRPPEIDPGELEESDEETGGAPSGRIELPESVNILFDREPGPPHAVQIDPIRSRGRDFDGVSGDDGIHLLLSVVDEGGMILPPERDLEVAILDPTADGAEARLGTWAFTAAELQRLARGDSEGRIPLPIHWQEAVPGGDSVVVFVRMELPGGGVTTTDRVVSLRRAGAELWTPRAGE